MPRPDRPLPRYLPVDSDRKLAAALSESTYRLAADALLLQRACGLRIGELLDLELDCVHEIPGQGSWLKIPLGKLDTERMVPLDDQVLTVIDRITTTRSPGRPMRHPRTGAPADFLIHPSRKTTVPERCPRRTEPSSHRRRVRARDHPPAAPHLRHRTDQRRSVTASADVTARARLHGNEPAIRAPVRGPRRRTARSGGPRLPVVRRSSRPKHGAPAACAVAPSPVPNRRSPSASGDCVPRHRRRSSSSTRNDRRVRRRPRAPPGTSSDRAAGLDARAEPRSARTASVVKNPCAGGDGRVLANTVTRPSASSTTVGAGHVAAVHRAARHDGRTERPVDRLCELRVHVTMVTRDRTTVRMMGGPGWIRTNVACRLVYSLFPLATRVPTQGARRVSAAVLARTCGARHAELRRRLRGRHAGGPQRGRPGEPRGRHPLRLQGHRHDDRAQGERRSSSTPRARTASPRCAQVLEEKLVKRKVSLKALDYGKVEEARGTARQTVTLVAGISPTRPARSTSSSRSSA